MKILSGLSVGKLADNLANRLDFLVSPLGDLIDRVKDAVARLKGLISQTSKEPVVSFTELNAADMADIFGDDGGSSKAAQIAAVLEVSDVFVETSDGGVAWYDQ